MKVNFLLLLAALSSVVAQSRAQKSSPKSESLLVLTDRLPAPSQRFSEAMYLYTSECDSSYLYLEQDNGKTLTILDVENPKKIKLKGVVSVDSTPYDFVRRISDDTVLIQYRDGSGFGFLSLHHPKKPSIKTINYAFTDTYIEPLDSTESGDLILPGSNDNQDYRVFRGKDAMLLATVKQVHQLLIDSVTGATYLLGQDGLTVVRNPRIELSAKFPCVAEHVD